jgi:DNA-binding IclR family transcriptional regulator
LLGDYTFDEIERRFRGVTFEPVGPTEVVHNVGDLYEQVQIARAQGFALVREEVESELVGVSSPIRDFRGMLIAALNMSAPKFRMNDRLEAAGYLTAKATRDLSEALGWVAQPRI